MKGFDLVFGEAIRAHRLNRDWSLGQLAVATGIHESRLNEVETGKSSPTSEELSQICDAFQIMPELILSVYY